LSKRSGNLKVVTHKVNPGYAHFQNRQDFFAHAFHALNNNTVAPTKYYEMSEEAYQEQAAKEAVEKAKKAAKAPKTSSKKAKTK